MILLVKEDAPEVVKAGVKDLVKEVVADHAENLIVKGPVHKYARMLAIIIVIVVAVLFVQLNAKVLAEILVKELA